MQMTAEISMYPFQENYRELIKGFIIKLNEYENLTCETSATATMVTGEYRYIMKVLTEMLEWSHQQHGRAVYVTKFIPGYLPDDN